jgi:hypothetical protein
LPLTIPTPWFTARSSSSNLGLPLRVARNSPPLTVGRSHSRGSGNPVRQQRKPDGLRRGFPLPRE